MMQIHSKFEIGDRVIINGQDNDKLVGKVVSLLISKEYQIRYSVKIISDNYENLFFEKELTLSEDNNNNSPNKPPLGIMPKNIWKLKRIKEISDAIKRYLMVRKIIPKEWMEEYNELIGSIKK